jgi:hypothetical protein
MPSELHRTRSLTTAGYRYDEIRRMLRGGGLSTVRRGTYLAGDRPSDAHERHRLMVRAAVPEFARGAVISHISAAVLHGLPSWRIPLDRVHVTRRRTNSGRRSTTAHVHVATLADDEVTCVDGIAVTSVERTVIDIARTAGFEQGVVVADAALAGGLTDPDVLARAVTAVMGRRGAPGARRTICFADRRSESMGESRSRVAIAAAGLPSPVTQWEVRDEDGRVVGRSDFGWPEQGVAGEFDGRIKYGRLLRPGESAADAVYREKRREDALREHLRTVVRWNWDDLDDFRAKAQRIRQALAP